MSASPAPGPPAARPFAPADLGDREAVRFRAFPAFLPGDPRRYHLWVTTERLLLPRDVWGVLYVWSEPPPGWSIPLPRVTGAWKVPGGPAVAERARLPEEAERFEALRLRLGREERTVLLAQADPAVASLVRTREIRRHGAAGGPSGGPG
ncbi:MAG TPA: hypothetical protein VMH78_06335 [Thermoplasmata archaeon]|nr:hypothetical protein [Thermoplasmata archaeon]